MEANLRRRRMPTALVEVKNEETRVYVGINPAELAGSGARKTSLTQRSWALWMWKAPNESNPDSYHYILAPNDGSDAILYARTEQTQCEADTLETP
jgi:hypothetical protein